LYSKFLLFNLLAACAGVKKCAAVEIQKEEGGSEDMSHDDRLRSTGALEKLQRWELYLSAEFEDILEEINALRTQPLVGEPDLRPRRENSQVNLPDPAELQEAVDELIGGAREHAALESASHRPSWFGPIEQSILSVGNVLTAVLDDVDRILAEAEACRHPFNCRCQRQFKLYEQRIEPALQIWFEFSAYAEALRKRGRRAI
jgi:hypothetical protein